MAVGDINKESLLSVVKLTVKSNEDIEKGELVCDDGSGNGIIAATAALAVTEKVYMALEAHDYSEVSYHVIPCVETGYVTVQKAAGAVKKNDKVVISSTAGEVTKLTKGDAPAGGVSTYYTTTIEAGVQTALDTNAGVIGTFAEDVASGTTAAKILLGVY